MKNSKPKISRKDLRLALARNNFALAEEYLGIALHDRKDEKYKRGVIDAAYNAAELCAKGLLSLKMDELPATHGGVVQKFGEIFCKSGILDKDLGRKLRVALVWRNKARYDKRAEITQKQGQEIVDLTETLLGILREELKERK